MSDFTQHKVNFSDYKPRTLEGSDKNLQMSLLETLLFVCFFASPVTDAQRQRTIQGRGIIHQVFVFTGLKKPWKSSFKLVRTVHEMQTL